MSQRTPCDLSVLLLTELKEILKTYCQSPAGVKNSKKHSHGFAKVTNCKLYNACYFKLCRRGFFLKCCLTYP